MDVSWSLHASFKLGQDVDEALEFIGQVVDENEELQAEAARLGVLPSLLVLLKAAREACNSPG